MNIQETCKFRLNRKVNIYWVFLRVGGRRRGGGAQKGGRRGRSVVGGRELVVLGIVRL